MLIRSEVPDQSVKQIRILLVDDHYLIRQALRCLLEKNADIQIVGEASDGEEAVSLNTEVHPDVIIMDIAMPKMDGLEATQQIKSQFPSVAILVLTIHNEPEDILSILDAGASGYLMKDVFGDDVLNAIRAVVNGEIVMSPTVFKQIYKYARRYPIKPVKLDFNEELAIRELEILKLVAKGVSNKEIAQTINLSSNTIKSYLTSIFSKLRVGSRTEAVIVGLKCGFLTINDLE